MSTILDTLKKLEEEKNVLEENVDLKKLMLQGDSSLPIQRRESKWSVNIFLIVFLVTGVGSCLLMAWALGYFPSASKTVASAPVQTQPQQPTTAQATPPAQPSRQRLGVAMGKIPESALPVSRDLYEEDLYYNPTPGNAVSQNVRGFMEEPKPAPVTQSQPAPVRQPATPQAPVETAALLPVEETIPVTEEPLVEIITPAVPGAEETPEGIIEEPPVAVARYDEESLHTLVIPGLRVKGVIYFSESNPANYLLVSTPKVPNVRLKVGERAAAATLIEIERDSAIFSYQGKMTRVAIGE